MSNTEKNSNSRIFDLGTILSVSTARLLTTDIYKVYDILSYLLESEITTLAMPKAIKLARPYILEKYPQLLQVTERPIKNESDLKKWLKSQIKIYGNSFELTPVPKDYRTYNFYCS